MDFRKLVGVFADAYVVCLVRVIPGIGWVEILTQVPLTLYFTTRYFCLNIKHQETSLMLKRLKLILGKFPRPPLHPVKIPPLMEYIFYL